MKQTITTAILGLVSSLLGCTETATPGTRPGPETAHVIVCAPGSFMSGNECIQPRMECPSGTMARDGQCVATPQVAVEEPVAKAVVAEDGKSYDEIVDPRRARREPRARALLVTEVQGLEALFAAVPKDATDRPQLIRRLAEGYIELGAAAARDGRAAKDAETATKSGKIERAAQQAAIKYYQMLVSQYPKFCRSGAPASANKGSGCNDETLYFLGLEYERTNDLDKARRTFLQLIQNWPQSDWVGHTYFQFGEMFRKDAVTDPTKWVFAEQSFQEAIKYPGKIQAPAYDRLADVYAAQGKDAQANATRAKAQGPSVAAP